MSFKAELSAVQALAEKMVQALTPAARASWHITGQIYQINAIQSLIHGVLALFFFGFCVWLLYYDNAKYKRIKESRYRATEGQEMAMLAMLIIGVVGGMITLIISLLTLTNVWYWVALFHPQLYAAHEILNAVINAPK